MAPAVTWTALAILRAVVMARLTHEPNVPDLRDGFDVFESEL